MKKHWIVETIKDHGPGAYYRYSITGTNLHQNGASFSWSVPNLDHPEYDLTDARYEHSGKPFLVGVAS